MVFTDGIIESNIKVIPQVTESHANASNMFKQCLFMIEIQQECSINKKEIRLHQQKSEIESRRNKMLQAGENKSIDHEQLRKINIELKQILEQIEENETLKESQKESNNYEQKYRLGNKLTYGTQFQLRHLFTGLYLSLNPHEMSQEYGCC